MHNWIKLRAEEIRAAEKERREEADRKTKAANELKQQLAPFWRELVGFIQICVKDFNAEFPESGRMIDQFETAAADSFMVRRTAYPAVTLKAQLNNAGTSVQYTISRTQHKGMNTVEKQGSFTYSLVAGHAVYNDASIQTHENAAKLLMDPFFEF
jgi:hypothetical protein